MRNFGAELSDEQLNFIRKAAFGGNILVDACIGSGKTTAIQCLCDEFPAGRKILYLTYNRLLKLDARAKIKRRNATVTNYHGFAYMALKNAGISAGIPDLIGTFNRVKPPIPEYDILVLDEYQDIDEELATLLEYVKSTNPFMQIIAVGDMEQKIYDKTALDIKGFISGFLEEYERLTFTKCFRLGGEHAAMLGRVWNKKITGVNQNCVVGEMDVEEAVNFLSRQRPGDILCLGSRTGDMANVLNELEDKYPSSFNKYTIYASIQDDDGNRAVDPTDDCAIFTTYDSSKGLERNICMVFDFTESYWALRMEKPGQSYEILRNVFCVAASRGKQRIIFVSDGEERLSEETLSRKPPAAPPVADMDISAMFDFKYREDVEECFSLLKITPLPVADRSEICIKNRDELIDLSPCIGKYQEAEYFDNYDIDREIELFFALHRDMNYLYTADVRRASTEEKILFLVSLETKQDRYRKQVLTPFVKKEEKRALLSRLNTVLPADSEVQTPCLISFGYPSGKKAFEAKGLADAVVGDTVYELKFVSELSHPHFLQCAAYMLALGLDRGVLWNTRKNEMFQITIPDKKALSDAVANAVTKRIIDRFYEVAE